MSMKRRPNPARSGYDTWAPIVTPWAAAAAHVSRNVEGSPAWNPQAMLALDTTRNIAASSPILQTPYDSPTSLLRSTATIGLRRAPPAPVPALAPARADPARRATRRPLRRSVDGSIDAPRRARAGRP